MKRGCRKREAITLTGSGTNEGEARKGESSTGGAKKQKAI
jgi:hypothetical protein